MKFSEIFNSKSIRVAAVGSLVVKLFAALFAFLNGILLARILGLEQFGLYTLVFATVLVLSVPVSFGLPNLLIRYVSKYEVEKNYGAIKGLLIRANQFVLCITAIIWIVAIISYFFWWKKFDIILVNALIYGFLLLPFIVLGTINAAALRGFRYVVLGQITDTLLRHVLLFSGLVIYYYFQIDLTPVHVLQIQICASIIALLAGYFFLSKKGLFRIKDVSPIFYNKKWFRETLPFSINNGIQVISSKAISYVLALFSGVEAVAIFDIASRAAALVAFTLDALNTAIAPHISTVFEKKDMRRLQQILTKTSRIVFVAAIPIVLIFILGGKPLLAFLFGDEYKAAYLPMIVLCVGQLVNTAAGSVGIVLYMTGKQAVFTKIVSVVTAINLLFSIPFVLFFDVFGAAMILSVSLVIQNVILVFYVKNTLKINTTIF